MTVEHSSVLLTVDVGNSQTVVGLYEGETLRRHWRLSSLTDRTADETSLILAAMLSEADPPPVDAVLASVVPALTIAWREAIALRVGRPPLEVGPHLRTNLVVRLAEPREIGADRVANAVAAIRRYGPPVVVVDFGTATTFDVVSAAGEYLGGAIAPGVGISVEALFARAARLSPVELRAPARAVGRSTEESLRSGILLGFAGQVEGMLLRIGEELGVEPRLVATGGLAPLISPHLKVAVHLDPFLTLEGLRILHELNRSSPVAP